MAIPPPLSMRPTGWSKASSASDAIRACPWKARAIVADYDPGDRRLTLHYGGQAPHMTQVLFARHLGLEERNVRVIAYDVGGGYGIKSHHYGDEFTVAALAMLLARPVRYWADRLESFVSDIHARDHVWCGADSPWTRTAGS